MPRSRRSIATHGAASAGVGRQDRSVGGHDRIRRVGGREGPTAQISAGFASMLARRLDLTPTDARIAVTAGIGSGIGAIFRAPRWAVPYSAPRSSIER